MVPKGKHALLFLNGILLGSHDTGSFKVLRVPRRVPLKCIRQD